MNPIYVTCVRIGCEAGPGDPCKPIAPHDGLSDSDQELQIASFHQVRMYEARSRGPYTEEMATRAIEVKRVLGGASTWQ